MCVFVCGALYATNYSVSQAAMITNQAINTRALAYYHNQLQTVTKQVAGQLKGVQGAQVQLAEATKAKIAAEKEAENKKQIALAAAKKAATKKKTSQSSVKLAIATPAKPGSHTFYAGQCTSYVASKKTIPWGGNAGQWLNNAAAEGYKTSSAPKTGAIVVTNESRSGHVAIVEAVKGDKILVSEMNYAGWGKITTREIPLKSGVIKGFITDDRIAS